MGSNVWPKMNRRVQKQYTTSRLGGGLPMPFGGCLCDKPTQALAIDPALAQGASSAVAIPIGCSLHRW